MVKEEGYNISDTGNWNSASDFSRLKIMKPLEFCDHYENIARFGYDTLIEELQNYGVPLDNLKLIGFERLISELLKICGNVKFAMKVVGTDKELEKIKDDLEKIRKLIPLLSKTISKQRKQIMKLDNKKYYRALDIVIKIKSNLNLPLNKNHLIFTDKKEFDPKAHKKQLMEDTKNLRQRIAKLEAKANQYKQIERC